MKLRILSSLSLWLFAAAAANGAQSADEFFLAGATNYLRTNINVARGFVTNGLALYPDSQKLTNLWELLNRHEQSQQQQDDKKDEQDQDQQNQQEKSEQEKKEEQQRQEQQKKDEAEQKKQEQSQQEQQQSAQDQRGKEPDEQPKDAADYARVMQMTPQQAAQLLEAQKAEEKPMMFLPQNLKTNRNPNRVFKDW